jgi:hypothetical protein
MKIQKIFNSHKEVFQTTKLGILAPDFWSNNAVKTLTNYYAELGIEVTNVSEQLKSFALDTAELASRKKIFDTEQDKVNFAHEFYYMLSRQVAMPPLEYLQGANTNNAAVINLANLVNDDFNFNAIWFEQTIKLLFITMLAHSNNNEVTLSFANFATLNLLKGENYNLKDNPKKLAHIAIFTLACAYNCASKLRHKISPDVNLTEYFKRLKKHLTLKSSPDLGLKKRSLEELNSLICEPYQNGDIKIKLCSQADDRLYFILDSANLGLENYHNFAAYENEESEEYGSKNVNPFVLYSLANFKYSPETINEACACILGHKTLKDAPFINHRSLFDKGFGSLALNKIELYTAQCINIKNLFNQWVLGQEFCLNVLKCSKEQINDYSFNLLKFLGFNDEEIEASNKYVCGESDLSQFGLISKKHQKLYTIDETLNLQTLQTLTHQVETLNYAYINNIIDINDIKSRFTQVEKLVLGKVTATLNLRFDRNNKIKTIEANQTGLPKKDLPAWHFFAQTLNVTLKNNFSLQTLLPPEKNKTLFSVIDAVISLIESKYLQLEETSAKVVGIKNAPLSPQLFLPL